MSKLFCRFPCCLLQAFNFSFVVFFRSVLKLVEVIAFCSGLDIAVGIAASEQPDNEANGVVDGTAAPLLKGDSRLNDPGAVTVN